VDPPKPKFGMDLLLNGKIVQDQPIGVAWTLLCQNRDNTKVPTPPFYGFWRENYIKKTNWGTKASSIVVLAFFRPGPARDRIGRQRKQKALIRFPFQPKFTMGHWCIMDQKKELGQDVWGPQWLSFALNKQTLKARTNQGFAPLRADTVGYIPPSFGGQRLSHWTPKLTMVVKGQFATNKCLWKHLMVKQPMMLFH